MSTVKWEKRFLRIAREVSRWSKDPGTKVGAVAVDSSRRILATGYNGLPAGMDDSPERLADRDFKLRHTVHAELNCILNAAKNGVSLDGSTLYVYGLPVCGDCGKSVVQAGVKRIVMCVPVDRPEWWQSHPSDMFRELMITVELYDDRVLDDG